MITSVILYTCLAGLATLAGIGLLRMNAERALRHSHYLNSAAAGFLLAVAFFHLMPEAAEMTGRHAMSFVGLGFIIFYLLETVLIVHSGAEMHFHGGAGDSHVHGGGGPEDHARGMVAFTGLLFHSLLDGIIVAVAFKADEHGGGHLGVLAAVSVILHELPEGVTTFSLLLKSLNQKAALWMSIAVAVATPVGAILSLALLPDLAETTYGIFLAVAAGSFLYVGASDLVPETHGKYGIRNAICLLAGAAIVYLTGVLIQGGH